VIIALAIISATTVRMDVSPCLVGRRVRRVSDIAPTDLAGWVPRETPSRFADTQPLSTEDGAMQLLLKTKDWLDD